MVTARPHHLCCVLVLSRWNHVDEEAFKHVAGSYSVDAALLHIGCGCGVVSCNI